MTTLKNLKGTAIQFRDEDPVLYVGSWSSGADLNTARKASMGFGVLTANIMAGGNNPGGGTTWDVVEQYNGTSWTEIAEINTARRSGKGAGTTTAGLVVGGVGTSPSREAKETEQWNGSAWTEVGDITRPASTQSFGIAGVSSTSALIFGGEPGTTYYVYTEKWDGSSWTEVNNLNTGRQSPAGFGIVTAAICAGGYSPPAPPGNVVDSNESWDGTNWTEVSDLNTARGQQGGSGSFTAGLIYGGSSPPGSNAQTESWDGTSYTEVADMATARYEFGYAPDGVSPQGNTGAIVAGGAPNLATTEEWAFPGPTSTILQEGDMWFNSASSTLKGYAASAGIPSGTWASGPSMNYAREGGNSGFGTQTAGVAVAGNPSPGPDTAVEHFDGSSWTNATAVPAARGQGGSAGPQTAGIIMGGFPSDTGLCYTYNGSSWTEIAELNTGRNVGMGFGSSTSAIYAGGFVPPNNKSEAEEWNGSAWSEGSDLNDSRRQGSAGGSSSAAGFVVGGYGGSPSTNSNQTETWNGTSFSEANELNTGRAYLTGGGEATLGITFGGGPIGPGYTNKTETWNGTSWTEQSDMASVSETSFGTTTGAAIATYRASGRIAGSVSAATEEWNVTAAVTTITTS